jgi:hypothetical protein
MCLSSNKSHVFHITKTSRQMLFFHTDMLYQINPGRSINMQMMFLPVYATRNATQKIKRGCKKSPLIEKSL